MTSVMLATYPEVFAGGAIIAGLPFGIASNVREALGGMMQSTSRPAEQIGRSRPQGLQAQGAVAESVGVARQRRSHRQPRQCQRNRQAMARRPRPAVAPMSAVDVDGHPREVWWNADGETVVESYTITDMAHGTPLGSGRQRRTLWRGRRVPDRGGNLVVLSHRKFLRPDRPRQSAAEAASRCRRRRSSHPLPPNPYSRPIWLPRCGRSPTSRFANTTRRRANQSAAASMSAASSPAR